MYFCIDDIIFHGSRYSYEGMVAYPTSWMRAGQGSWMFCSVAVRNSIAPVARFEAVPPWLELRTRWRLCFWMFGQQQAVWRACLLNRSERMMFLAVKAPWKKTIVSRGRMSKRLMSVDHSLC
jgi:hypothetical protein